MAAIYWSNQTKKRCASTTFELLSTLILITNYRIIPVIPPKPVILLHVLNAVCYACLSPTTEEKDLSSVDVCWAHPGASLDTSGFTLKNMSQTSSAKRDLGAPCLHFQWRKSWTILIWIIRVSGKRVSPGYVSFIPHIQSGDWHAHWLAENRQRVQAGRSGEQESSRVHFVHFFFHFE